MTETQIESGSAEKVTPQQEAAGALSQSLKQRGVRNG